MKINRVLRKVVSGILTAAAVVVYVYLQSQDGREYGRSAPPALPPVAGETASVTTPNGYTLIDGCRLTDDRGNDGDSFFLETPGGDTLHLRLYFADCPEIYPNRYNGDRIREQGDYFGGLSQKETIAVGQEAKMRVRRLLSSSVFQVATRWEEVFDSGRYYGFIRFRTGPESGKYLSEVLFREGLARFKTKGANLPDGQRASTFKRHLQGLEDQAKSARRGAWGI